MQFYEKQPNSASINSAEGTKKKSVAHPSSAGHARRKRHTLKMFLRDFNELKIVYNKAVRNILGKKGS